MKNIVRLIPIITAIMLSSCYEDKGNYAYTEIPTVEVTGIATNTEKNVGDVLAISPTIKESTQTTNEYYWIVSKDADYRQRDTLSTERDINVVIALAPNSYYAMYQVKDVATQVIKAQIKFRLHVSDKDGWLLLTDEGNSSNVTMIVTSTSPVTIEKNLIAQPMSGKAGSFAYLPNHAYNKLENAQLKTAINNCIAIGTANDMKFYNVASFEVEREFKDLFSNQFIPVTPTAVHPVILPGDMISYSNTTTASPSFTLINDGTIYLYNGENDYSGLILLPLNNNVKVDNSLIFPPVHTSAGNAMGYDKISGRYFSFAGSKASSLSFAYDSRLAELQFVRFGEAAYLGVGNQKSSALVKNSDNEYKLITTGDVWGQPQVDVMGNGLTQEIADKIIVSSDFVSHATNWPLTEFMYSFYSDGNQMNYLSMDNSWEAGYEDRNVENHNFATYAAGENVTAFAHFTDDVWATDPYIKLAVATYNGTKGKLYVYTSNMNDGDPNMGQYELTEEYDNLGKIQEIRRKGSSQNFISCVQ